MRTSAIGLALLTVLAVVGACSAPTSSSDAAPAAQGHSGKSVEEAMKVRIIAAGPTFTAELENSAAARDFAALLPLELTLGDYNRTEKIADLPRHLATDSASDGIQPVAGDLTYYAPWGNLAIFYRDFGYSRGLVLLGRIEGDVEGFAKIDGPVRIERIDE